MNGINPPINSGSTFPRNRTRNLCSLSSALRCNYKRKATTNKGRHTIVPFKRRNVCAISVCPQTIANSKLAIRENVKGNHHAGVGCLLAMCILCRNSFLSQHKRSVQLKSDLYGSHKRAVGVCV